MSEGGPSSTGGLGGAEIPPRRACGVCRRDGAALMCLSAALAAAAASAAGGCKASMMDVMFAVPDRSGVRFEPVNYRADGTSVPYGQWQYGRWTYE